MASCQVCTEKYTSLVRKVVTCLHCGQAACRSCCAQYILASSTAAECMSCKKNWSLAFISENFTRAWTNGAYRDHRQKVLLERQRLLLPESLEAARQHKRVQGLERELHSVQNKYAVLNQARRVLNTKIRDMQYQRTMGWPEHLAPRPVGRGWRPATGEAEEEGGDPGAGKGPEETRDAKKVTGRCPDASSDCRGFVVGGACQLCAAKTCRSCAGMLSRDENAVHECDPGDIATRRLLAADSKKCPKCFVDIQKVDGCQQMWCTGCRTFFCWRTLEILKGEHHNPHYAEFMRQQRALQPGANAADGCADMQPMQLAGSANPGTAQYHMQNSLETAHLDAQHARSFRGHYDARRYQADMEELRVAWLLGEIKTEEEWRARLERTDHKYNKLRDVVDIQNAWGMVAHTIVSGFFLYQHLHPQRRDDQGCEGWNALALQALLQVKALTLRAEDSLAATQRMYNSAAAHQPTARPSNSRLRNQIFIWQRSEMEAAEKAWRFGDVDRIDVGSLTGEQRRAFVQRVRIAKAYSARPADQAPTTRAELQAEQQQFDRLVREQRIRDFDAIDAAREDSRKRDRETLRRDRSEEVVAKVLKMADGLQL